MKTKILLAAVFAIALGAIYWHFNHGIAVIVRNVGSEPIRSVVVQATGFSGTLGRIDAGQSKTVIVSASGRSHLELEHADGSRLVVRCHFEHGDSGSIHVDVSAKQILRKECNVRAGVL